jgi:hypothetical protein
MSLRLSSIAILLALGTLGTLGASQALTTSGGPLVVHEWGTFTSVAGQDGSAVEWLPLGGPPDLPCFVDRFRLNIKGSLRAKVRMETPVLYFYTSRDITVNVKVRFRQGIVTEWFPHAAVLPGSADVRSLRDPDFASSISWSDVRVAPGAPLDFPSDRSGSHYYLARQTDASPLQSGSEKEKFLFYRGVGDFEPPISAMVGVDGSIVVRNPGGGAVGDIVLFENRGGTIVYQVRHVAGAQVTFGPPSLDGEFAAPQAELERILIAHGLYRREAKAMVDTWRDSWFEEGTRLFYIAPPKAIDAILPLEISPRPDTVARVFVGRVELVTSTAERKVEDAIARNDRQALESHGRFLQPIADRLLARVPPAERARMQARLDPVYASDLTSSPAACR